MNRILIFGLFLVVGMFILSGCAKTEYVCSDGQVVLNPSNCPSPKVQYQSSNNDESYQHIAELKAGSKCDNEGFITSKIEEKADGEYNCGYVCKGGKFEVQSCNKMEELNKVDVNCPAGQQYFTGIGCTETS